jgi:hypothetical protein
LARVRVFALGQRVRLAAQPSQEPGRVVGAILKEPYQALVRWKDEMTFEALDDLVEVTLPPAGLPRHRTASGEPIGDRFASTRADGQARQ